MDGGTTESSGGGRRTIVEGLGSLEGWWNVSGIVLWSFVFFGAFMLNATLLVAFVKRPGLRTISNRFVMNLAVSNLLACAVLNPLLILDGRTSSDATMCSIAESATALVTSSSIFSVLLIAVDQYLAVVDPLRYRTRIDKLKCGMLVISVWLVSLVFAVLAGLNPSPRSAWLVCAKEEPGRAVAGSEVVRNETLNLTIDASLKLVVNASELVDEGLALARSFDENVRLLENASEGFIEESFLESPNKFLVSYGLVYAVAYAVIAYLLPFVLVCWIYVSIYSAAHKNSERTRRTGSRPILSSASLSEEYYAVRQDVSNEDFRRLPKISSLSSIDESIETHSPSQTIMPRRDSEDSATPGDRPRIEEEQPVTVVFTVGSKKVNVTPQRPSNASAMCTKASITKDTISDNKVPISVLKAKFLDSKEPSGIETAKSKFREQSDERMRKSSHDLMYEEALRSDLEKLRLGASTDDENEVDDDDNQPGVEKEEIIVYENERTNDVSRDEPRVPENTKVDIANEEEEEEEEEEENEEDEDVSTSRKSSLDYENVTNGRLPSSKTKIQSNGFFTGKLSSRNLTNFHQSHQGMNPYEEHFYGKTVNLESHQVYGGTVTNAPIVTITPPNKSSGLHRVSSVRSTSSYINSLKHRISNGSLFKYREETRAARISALVIVMGLICWTPYVIVLVLRNLVDVTGKRVSHESDVAAMSFIILATYVTPLLFGYRSRRVKRELRKFFCFRRELSYKNNRSLMAKKVLKRRHSGNLSQFEMDARYNIFNCVYGRNKWPKDKVHFVQVPETALVVETCRSSFSSGASTQISSTSTEEC